MTEDRITCVMACIECGEADCDRSMFSGHYLVSSCCICSYSSRFIVSTKLMNIVNFRLQYVYQTFICPIKRYKIGAKLLIYPNPIWIWEIYFVICFWWSFVFVSLVFQPPHPWVSHPGQSQLLNELVDFLLLLLFRHVGGEAQCCRKVQVLSDCQCSHHHIILDMKKIVVFPGRKLDLNWFNDDDGGDDVFISDWNQWEITEIIIFSFPVSLTCTTYPDRHLKFGGWGAPLIRTSPFRPAGSFLAARISRNLKDNQPGTIMYLEFFAQ